MTIRTEICGNPRLHAVVDAAEPGMDADALVTQLAEEAVIFREARCGTSSDAASNPSRTSIITRKRPQEQHGFSRGALNDQTLSGALDQMSHPTD